jgi:hypothetical protein
VKVEAAWAAVKQCPQGTLPSKLVWFFRHGESESNVAMHAARLNDKDVRNSFIFRTMPTMARSAKLLSFASVCLESLSVSAAGDT